MSANINEKSFNKIFSSMNEFFDTQEVGQPANESKPAGILGGIKKWYSGLSTIEKAFLIFVVLVFVIVVLGYIFRG